MTLNVCSRAHVVIQSQGKIRKCISKCTYHHVYVSIKCPLGFLLKLEAASQILAHSILIFLASKRMHNFSPRLSSVATLPEIISETEYGHAA